MISQDIYRSWNYFRSLWLSIPGLIVVVTLCCFDGLVIFAVYADCDLKESGKVTSNDQVFWISSMIYNHKCLRPGMVNGIRVYTYTFSDSFNRDGIFFWPMK